MFVAARAIVAHWDGSRGGGGINAISQRDRGESVRVLNARADQHRFASRGQNRGVRYIKNRRRGIRSEAAVPSTRRTEIRRNIHCANGFEPISAETEKQLRIPAKPSDFGAN